jgi:hypothetical protein
VQPKMREGLAVVNVVRTSVLGGVLACLLAPYASAQDSVASSPSQYVMDAKEARAMAAQLEHRKTVVSYAVSDFERSLYTLNVSHCVRRIDASPELFVEGVRMRTCNELVEERRRIGGASHEKLKLKNEEVELTEAGARVTVDVMPTNEHHIIRLKEIHEHWLVTSFTSTAKQ